MSDWKEAWFTETLAAAYAEAGDFENAVKWQIATEKLYSEEDKAKCASVLPLYQSHQPFRDTGPEA
jgi:serine/threonine-protein kinase